MSDYIIENDFIEDYLNFETSEEKNINPAHDFYLKTECYFMGEEEEIKGTLILKKEMLVFESNQGLSRGNLKNLQHLDYELFEKEIEQMET